MSQKSLMNVAWAGIMKMCPLQRVVINNLSGALTMEEAPSGDITFRHPGLGHGSGLKVTYRQLDKSPSQFSVVREMFTYG